MQGSSLYRSISQITIEIGDDLRTRTILIRAKGGGRGSHGNPLLHRPSYSVLIVNACRHIAENSAGDSGFTVKPP